VRRREPGEAGAGPDPAEGRIASASGAVLLDPGSDPAEVARIARLLDALFAEVLLVGAAPPPDAPGRRVQTVPPSALGALVGALEAATADAVLAVDGALPAPPPALALALFAWPEADVVAAPGAAGRPPACALYRRASVLPLARARLREGARDLDALLGSLETASLEPADLERLDPARLARLDPDRSA
jgi:molybdopterin-guanine dinucleotide biosynthesis protein A